MSLSPERESEQMEVREIESKGGRGRKRVRKKEEEYKGEGEGEKYRLQWPVQRKGERGRGEYKALGMEMRCNRTDFERMSLRRGNIGQTD